MVFFLYFLDYRAVALAYSRLCEQARTAQVQNRCFIQTSDAHSHSASLHAHVALSRYEARRIFALVRASSRKVLYADERCPFAFRFAACSCRAVALSAARNLRGPVSKLPTGALCRRAMPIRIPLRYMLMSRCRAMRLVAYSRLCEQALTALYAPASHRS